MLNISPSLEKCVILEWLDRLKAPILRTNRRRLTRRAQPFGSLYPLCLLANLLTSPLVIGPYSICSNCCGLAVLHGWYAGRSNFKPAGSKAASASHSEYADFSVYISMVCLDASCCLTCSLTFLRRLQRGDSASGMFFRPWPCRARLWMPHPLEEFGNAAR
jgi:hypothetical protein